MRKSALALLGFTTATAGAAALGWVAARRSVDSLWYRSLRKPAFQPPAAVFGPVWTTLYGLMAVSAWRVWRQPASLARTRALTLWSTQLALNAAWTWIFFGARKPRAAAVELGALLVAVTAYANEARKVDPLAATLIAPYGLWTRFASKLNDEVARQN